ncbi:TPA: hypothetical protein OUD88_002866 [Enterobacter hormaechei]|nr:hypothetical protein [Enterobacter hormaechei]
MGFVTEALQSIGLGASEGDSNMMKGVKGALTLGLIGTAGTSGAGAHATANANAQAFHYQSNANPVTELKTGFDYMKNDINVNNGFNSLKHLF